MKIRFLIANAYVGGGTARTTSNTASALAQRGHDVEIVSLLRRRNRPQFPPDERVRLTPLVDQYAMEHDEPPESRLGRMWFDQGYRRKSLVGHRGDKRTMEWNWYTDLALLRYLRSVRDGVLIGTRPALNVAITRFAHRDIVLVGQDHVNLRSYQPGLVDTIRRRYHVLDALATLTSRDCEDYTALIGDRTRVLTMPNAMTPVGANRAELESKVVVAAGRLTHQKGFDRLLPVWAKVAPQRPDWRLELYGAGGQEPKLKRNIAKLGIGDSLQLMGRSNKLFEKLAASSVYVMTSRFEGFPMVLLEAMGVGLPVLAYDCPTGPREIVTEGVDGHVVDDGDVDALAARMIELMDDPEKRKRYGAAAVRKAADYDIDVLAERWETLFGELAAAKGVRV